MKIVHALLAVVLLIATGLVHAETGNPYAATSDDTSLFRLLSRWANVEHLRLDWRLPGDLEIRDVDLLNETAKLAYATSFPDAFQRLSRLLEQGNTAESPGFLKACVFRDSVAVLTQGQPDCDISHPAHNPGEGQIGND